MTTLARLELKVPPPAVFAVCAALLWLLARWAPMQLLPRPQAAVVAAVLLAAGAGVAAAGVLAFRRHHTTVNPHAPGRAARVVRSGIYRFSRNPMYLGLLLVLAAVAVTFPSAPGVLVLALFVGYLDRFQIRPEERALLQKFGAEYAAYQRAVRRWL